jgi:hypothetical protein
MDNKAELVIMALQQRIGELVSNYETQIAVLRLHNTLSSKKKKKRQQKNILEALKKKLLSRSQTKGYNVNL